MNLIARESFHAQDRFVAAGSPVDADDPIVAGREHLFEAEVEQATAEPGEKRGRRPSQRTAARKDAEAEVEQATAEPGDG